MIKDFKFVLKQQRSLQNYTFLAFDTKQKRSSIMKNEILDDKKSVQLLP